MEKSKKIRNKINYTIDVNESEIIILLRSMATIMIVFEHANYSIAWISGNVFAENYIVSIIKKIFSGVIPCFAVPTFFILSSILLYSRDDEYLANLKKKVKSLVVPWLSMISFWLLVYYIILLCPYTKQFITDESRNVLNWKWDDYLNAYIGFRYPKMIYGPLWFVRDLFILNILAPVIKKAVDFAPKLLFIIIIVIFIAGINVELYIMHVSAILWFSLGYYFVKYDIRLSSIGKIANIKVVSMAYLGIVILRTCLSHEMAMSNLIEIVNIFIAFIWHCSIYYYIKKRCNSLWEIFLIINKYSFGIYVFHQIPLTIIEKILFRIMPLNNASFFLQWLLAILMVLGGCLTISMVLDNYFPRLFYLIFGGRKGRANK